MRKLILATLITCIAACSTEERPLWNDIDVIRVNTEAPRAYFTGYADEAAANARDIAANDRFLSLNGEWKFNYVDRPADRPADFWQQDYDVSGWDDTPVPSNWEREGYVQFRKKLAAVL